ncbi:MAG: DNA-formamidopyrimidine glycosylase family protein [Candidatus Thorarchaeota archaeon]
MSIELPEASILSKQMNKIIVGKEIADWRLDELEKLQKSKMVNEDVTVFDQLKGRTIESIESRGNCIVVKFDKMMNLILSPEYGGSVLYHEDASSIPKKIHLKLDFTDGSILTTRLKGWGSIYVAKDSELSGHYVYRRDFSDVISPDESGFTFERFSGDLEGLTKNIKAVLVGKEAVLVGIQNSGFQDIIYRAGIHPKRKASEMNKQELEAIYTAIVDLIRSRIKLGGKDQFSDLFGKQGEYVPVMGPNMKDQKCPKCDSAIEKLAHGGGHVYLCPSCQK